MPLIIERLILTFIGFFCGGAGLFLLVCAVYIFLEVLKSK